MLPDRVSNPGPLTYESGALPIALRGPAAMKAIKFQIKKKWPELCCFPMNFMHVTADNSALRIAYGFISVL